MAKLTWAELTQGQVDSDSFAVGLVVWVVTRNFTPKTFLPGCGGLGGNKTFHPKTFPLG